MINEDRKKLYDALSDEYDLGTYEEFERNIGDSVKRRKLYDAAIADYDLGDYESYSKRIGPTHKENLDAFVAEHGSFLNDFEARDTAETNMSRAGMSSGIIAPTENSITGEERARYLDLHKQEEALKKAWYTSDEYLSQRDSEATQLSEMNKAINAGRVAYAQANPPIKQEGLFQINPYAVRGVEADNELQMYETASRIMDDAIKMHNAPSRYDGANVFMNIGKFIKGAKDTASDIDIWTAGLTEITDNFGIREVLSNVQSKLGNLNDLSEDAIENILTPAEKAVLQAWAVNTQQQLKRKDDLSRGYQAGQGAVESLGFMAEFALTGGVGKAASEGVETMAKWLGKKALTTLKGTSDEVAERVMQSAGKKITKNAVGKYGAGLAESLAEAAGRTGVMPSTYRNISEKATEIQTDEEGNNRLISMNDAFASGLADSFIETLSEGGRVNAIGELFGDVAGKIPAYKKMVDKLSHTKMGEMWNAINSSDIMNTLRAGGWHGLGEEYLEEWYGNALRTLTGVDKDALKDFATVDNQIVTITSFLPLTIFGGSVSTAQVLSASRDLNKKAEALKSALMERGYDEAQANNMIDMMRGATPAEVSETLTPIVNAVAARNENEAAALMRPVGQFAAAVQRWQAFDTKYTYQEQEQRDNLRANMEESIGQFWQEDANGRQTVLRGVNDKGEAVYLLAKPTAEAAEAGVIAPEQSVPAVTADGRKVFVQMSDYQFEDELEMNDFLGNEIMAEKGNSEQARMIEEKDAQLAAIRESASPGTEINIGTAEAPVRAVVMQRSPDGVIVSTPDGAAREISYEEFGNYVGINANPLTDAQIDERDADALSAERSQREAQLDQEYDNYDAAGAELIEAEEEIEQAVVAAEQLPLKSDGSVDQTALWNQDPVRWAQWNDEQRQDGGANSLAYINGAIAREEAMLAELDASYQAEPDFDNRSAMEAEINKKKDRLNQLTTLQNQYVAAQQAAAAPAVEATPAQEEAVAPRVSQQMSEEEKAQMDAQHQTRLEKAKSTAAKREAMQAYVNEISQDSVPMTLISMDGYEQVMKDAGCSSNQITQVKTALAYAKRTNRQIPAFYVPRVGIFAFVENIPDIEQLRLTYVHERQHRFTAANKSYLNAILQLGLSRERMAEIVYELSGSYFYKNDTADALVDEIISYAMERAYTYEDFSVALQELGIEQEIIDIVTEIDNEQRSDNTTYSSRRGGRSNLHDDSGRQGDRAENDRNQEPISGGLLDEQGDRPLGLSDRGTRSTGEGAEVISEEQLDAPNSGNPQQITAADGEVIADTNGKGGVIFSIRTWLEGGRDYLAAWLAKDSTLADDEKADILARMDEFYQNAILYSDTYVPFGTWSEAGVRYDNNGNPLMSVIKANGDYAMNLDFSLVCKKRRPLNRLLRTLINRNAFGTYSLKEREIAEINWILQEHGFEVACALCFVDAKRYRVSGVADVFAALYNRLVKAIAPQGVKIAHFNYSNNPNVEAVEGGIDTLPDEQLNWKRLDNILKGYKKGSVEHKVAQFLRNHPEQRKLVDATDFIEAEGFESVKEANPELLKLYNSKKGTGGPKASFGDVQYLNDILKNEKSFSAKKAYAVGGVRLQSFSDFVPHMYFDYMQLFAELAAKKLPVHAYTKEVLFAKIFGLTGAKINLSLVPAVVEGGIAPGLDAEGNYVWADVIKDAEGNIIQQGQTFPFDEAMAIQNAEGYSKNCGAIAVGISDEHIEKMLDDPNIQFIIPYHKSSLNAIVARMTNIDQYKDYTNVQNTKKASGSKLDKGTKDFNFNEHLHGLGENGTPQQAAQAYLDWCRENRFVPKFSQFAYHPNYYKLLVDFNTIDTTTGEYSAQGPVTMTFPSEQSAFGNVETLIQQGLQEDEALEEKMETEIDSVADEVEKRLAEIAKEPAMSEKQKAVRMAELADERTAKIQAKAKGEDVSFRITPEMDAEYLRAVEAGDMETVAKMVAEAVKLAMPNTTVVDENGYPREVYRVDEYRGNKNKYTNVYGGVFYADTEEYFDHSDTGHKKENAEPFYINTEGFFDPMSEMTGLMVNSWADILGKKSEFEKYDIEDESDTDRGFYNDGEEVMTTSTDGLALAAQRMGYKGVILRDIPQRNGNDFTEYAVFNSNAIKSAKLVTYDDSGNVIPLSERFNPENEDIRFRVSNENQAIFVSNAAKAVEGIKQEKATPEQWLKMIEKNGGLKAGEDKWIGLSDWLKTSDKKTLTKDEVMQFVNEHMIVIEETHYTGDAEDDAASRHDFLEQTVNKRYKEILNGLQEIEDYDERRFKAFDLFQKELGEFADLVELDWSGAYLTFSYEDLGDYIEFANRFGVDIKLDNPIHETRLAYTTPGLENHHEIALTVPTIESWNASDDIHFGDAGDGRAIAWIRFGETQKLLGTVEVEGKKKFNWAKVLVIDEIQSKRHQEGRDMGYSMRREEYQKRLDALETEAGDRLKRRTELLRTLKEKYGEDFRAYLKLENTAYVPNESVMSPEEVQEWNATSQEEINDAIDALKKQKRAGVPDAPFDKNWYELAMKRMLRYAAESGYDVIAWTKGEQQAERYNIGNYVSSIEAQETEEDGRWFGLYMGDSDDATLIKVDDEGIVIRGDDNLSQAEGRPLSDLVGKEMSIKMMQMEEYDVLEDIELKVGGEGMKGFYDKMLPAFMNKYGKKWGIKVEDVNLPGLANGLTMHSVPVTEEMKASVMEGQVMFRVRGENESAMDFHQSMIDAFLAKYEPNAEVKLYPINRQTAKEMGVTIDELKKMRGMYLSDEDIIAIFANEEETNGEEVENSLFHESIHKLVNFYPYMVDAGKWLWDNASMGSVLTKHKDMIEQAYVNAPEAARYEEMLAWMLGSCMEEGCVDILASGMPANERDIIEQITNEIGYDIERESIQRTGRKTVESKEPGKAEETRGESAGEGKNLGEEIRFRTSEITPEVRAEMNTISAVALVNGTYLKAPNGADTNLNPEQWAMVRTKNFKSWFGDWEKDPENASKVVDENGEPRVVYHGGSSTFTKFDTSLGDGMTDLGQGSYFSSSEEVAREYTVPNGDNQWQIDSYIEDHPFLRELSRTQLGLAEAERIAIEEVFKNAKLYPVFLNLRNPYRTTMEDFNNGEFVYLYNRDGLRGYDGIIDDTFKNRFEDFARGSVQYVAFEPSQIKSATDNIGEFSDEVGDIRYRIVTDPAKIEELENGPKIKVYRAMQLIDGKLYPPMSAKVDGQLREPIELGQWEEAEERPDLADNKGYFKLDKGNKTSLKARYNPYFHTSPTPLNDQFSSAQSRPELVTVEVEIPESELTSGYKAEKAKDSVGEKEWKAGVIQGKLSGTRKVILSRWDKPVRIVPDSEVADIIVKMFEGRDIVMPSNVVTPSLRAELESRGVPFVETDNQGKPKTKEEVFAKDYFQLIDDMFSGKKNLAEKYQMRYFDLAETPDFYKSIGIIGDKFTVKYGTISAHFGKDKDHRMTEEAWKELPSALANPIFITQYGNKSNKFRIYTSIKLGDRFVIAGVDVIRSNQGKNKPMIEINSIRTVFAAKRIGDDEKLICYNEQITPEQEALLNGRNFRQYPTIQELSESKDSDNIDTSNEYDENISYRITGTPTEQVVAEGVSLSPADMARVAGRIFSVLPEEARREVTASLNGNILGLQDAIMQIPARLAMKQDWDEQDMTVAETIAAEMDRLTPDKTRPFSTYEGLWMLYDALTPASSLNLMDQASRAIVKRNLGVDEATLERMKGYDDDVRFRTVGDATINAEASLYNKGASNVWTRLKESFVDMNASVEQLVKAIEKKTGMKAQGFENILNALNQQSSKGLAAMKGYTRTYLKPMFKAIREIMDNTDFKYEDIVRYVILKHGLERNKKLAQRDARAHYQEIYDDIITKIKGLSDAQKRTYLTNAQLRDADAKAELAVLQNVNTSILTDEQKREHKRDLAKARKAAEEAAEYLERAKKIASLSEQEAQDELDKIFENIENGTDSVYQELRKNDYSGISSMFYDQLGVDRKDYSTEEQYQSALMLAKNDKYSTLADVEAAAESEVDKFERLVNTDNLWKRINAATKETLRQQYEANMISRDQYESLRNMFEYYVPLRGFKDNTAEDMYTYYRKPNSTGYTKPILGAEGRKTEAESPFGWIAAMAGSAVASNVKNQAKLALYYFVSNRPENGIATISRTWFVDSGEVDADGKKIFKPAYPPFTEDLSSDAAKASYEAWQENMRELQKKGQAYESGQRLNLGNAVVNISDANKPEHIVNVKVAGKDYTILINGNPRAAQAINGQLNIEASAQDYTALFGPVLRWMSSVNTSYNPEFWITNMMRDMLFTFMSVNTKEDAAYRRKFAKNYLKAFKVVKMVHQNEKGIIGDSYLENMYKEFEKNGGVTGYTQIKGSEEWEKEIAKQLASEDPEGKKAGKMMRKVMDGFSWFHRTGESLEQVSRFAAFLTAREMGKPMSEAIDDAKEITVNFNRKGSGKRITFEEARYLTDKNGQPLNAFQQWMAVGLSSIAPLGRRTIMFFNAAMQGLNATAKLVKKNPQKMAAWSLAYFAIGVMNAVLHNMFDDDDDYLDMPEYERRNALMLGGNGVYFKWALPQEMRMIFGLGDLAVEAILGRNPHESTLAEAVKIVTEVLPINPTEGWRAFLPSVAIPFVELGVNEDYKGDPIYNEQKWLSEGEKERTAKWSSAYKSTGRVYIEIAKALNSITGGDEYDAGLINLQPEKIEYLVQSAFGGTVRTADKFVSSVINAIDPEESMTVRQTPFLNRVLTLNDERYKNVHVNDVFEWYENEILHAISLEKKFKKENRTEKLEELKASDEYKWIAIYKEYEKDLKLKKAQLKAAPDTRTRMELTKAQDEIKKKVIKEISALQ